MQVDEQPPKRKGAAAAADGVVWAKVKGFAAWPARVVSESKGRSSVVFFGTHDTAEVADADITAWADGGALRKKSKAKGFLAAVEEAEREAGAPAPAPPPSARQKKRQKKGAAAAKIPKKPATTSPPAEDPASPPETDEAPATMSAYEQQRLDNIARNEAMLRTLNIEPINMAPAPRPRARVRGLKPTKKNKEPVVRRERSLRLAGKTPDGAELPASFKEPTFAEMTFKGENRQYDRIEGDITLADALQEEGRGMKRKPRKDEDEDVEETEDLVEQRRADTAAAFGGVLGGLASSVGAAAARAAYDEAQTMSMLQSLTVAETDVAKVVPERIYSLAWHPSPDKLLVAAGDKWGRVGFFAPDAEDEASAVTLFAPHTRPVCCLAFDANDSGKLYSTSYDNTVRCLDAGAMRFTDVFSGDEDMHLCYTALMLGSDKTLYAAYNHGELGVVDLRIGDGQHDLAQTLQLHERKISHVAVHPTATHTLATASNDGTVVVWDARKMRRASDALGTFSHGRAATSAFFSPITGERLLTTSYDDLVRVIELPGGGAKIPEEEDEQDKIMRKIRHDNQTGRWLTNFRATWDPKNDNTFVIGSMKQPRGVDFFTGGTTPRKWTNVRMTGEFFTTVSSLNAFHPVLDVVAGGNSSGKVSIWR